MPWTNVPQWRVTIEGHLGTSEMFSTSFWLLQTNAQLSSGPQAVSDGVVTALQTNGTGATTMLARLKTLLGTADGWDRVRAYQYASGNNQAVASSMSVIPSGVGTGSRTLPYQCALAATLQSAQAGRAHRGRMFIPVSQGVSTNGLNSSTIVDPCATALGDLFGNLKNGTSGLFGRAVIWSATHDFYSYVTSIRVDDKVDIQRSRAVKLASVYQKTYSGL